MRGKTSFNGTKAPKERGGETGAGRRKEKRNDRSEEGDDYLGKMGKKDEGMLDGGRSSKKSVIGKWLFEKKKSIF